MCVILVCPPKVRPLKSVLYAWHDANPHGAGLAWRENGKVRWLKNLGPAKLTSKLKELPGEVVIHFRWASVGGVDARLCHPFPVTPKAPISLSGTAESVLFHNGTWKGYEDALDRLQQSGVELPRAPMSDSRAAALLVNATQPDTLKRLPGKWVWMSADETKLYGEWQTWGGMRVSNTHFLPRIRRKPVAPFSHPNHTQVADMRLRHQPALFSMPDEA
jgi:hypothetical protein